MTGKLSKNFHGVGIGPLSNILAVKEMDQALKLITEPSELLGLKKSFRTKAGYVRQQLYQDGVHLDEKATQTLAEQIFNKVGVTLLEQLSLAVSKQGQRSIKAIFPCLKSAKSQKWEIIKN